MESKLLKILNLKVKMELAFLVIIMAKLLFQLIQQLVLLKIIFQIKENLLLKLDLLIMKHP